MSASYRLQLGPDFTFAAVRRILPYLARLGVSHLYLSPITEARPGSSHGYDVVDHNRIRAELGGAEGFAALRREAVAAGLSLILDFVPNHSGVGPHNAHWQDVLAYGPYSSHAQYFDINWRPLLPELREKILLPFLGRPYGEALDAGEIGLVFEEGRFYASYFEDRFALSPASYDAVLSALLPSFERSETYFDLQDLARAYGELERHERDKAEGLRTRLLVVSRSLALNELLDPPPEWLHELLERQFWRLAYWKTAGYDINYRRFFDINGLVALRLEREEVFWETHRLAGELVNAEGVAGLRIDHIDGLFDPQGYLEHLRALGAREVWVEKILAPGETLPEAWLTAGTTGYDFLNDVMHLLTCGAGEAAVRRSYRRYLGAEPDFEAVVAESKRLVMETSLSGELLRLATELKALAEADYHTRDFTQEALKGALAELTAALKRYRSYLPHQPEEARAVVAQAAARAKRRNPAVETSVYDFVVSTLLEEGAEALEPRRRAFVGRFQQYTAPVAAKGVEDTAFYRYAPLAALNEVGGEPLPFGLEPQVFHSRARFRAYRYPHALLATATHDHKRGEDTRMRLIELAEHAAAWEGCLAALSALAEARHGGGLAEPLPEREDRYLLFQLLVALWDGSEPEALAERLVAYMQKAVREAKVRSSWLDPDLGYEAGLERMIRDLFASGELGAIVGPLSGDLARHGFVSGLAQLLLKLTTPGVPDLYQGSELLDLSLVDPDNRRLVDYGRREELLDGLEPLLQDPDPARLAALLAERDERLKLYLIARLLRFRRSHEALFGGDYQPLQAGGEAAEHLIAFRREGPTGSLIVVAPRWPAALERAGSLGETRLELAAALAERGWLELLGGQRFGGWHEVALAALPLGMGVFHAPSAAPGEG